MPTKNFKHKLCEVMEEVAYIQKTGTNDFHHYNYATAGDVLTKVNAALTKRSIASIVIPELISLTDVTNAKGNTEHLATVKVEVQLVDADSNEIVVLGGLGSGQDAGDKACMKAQTAAIKYAYLLSLAISSGDDPEADVKTDENANIADNAYAAKSNIVSKPTTIDKPATVRRKTSSPVKDADWGICDSCGSRVPPKVVDFSMDRFKGCYCWDCQQKLKSA